MRRILSILSLLSLSQTEELIQKCLSKINETEFRAAVYSLYESINMGKDYAKEGLSFIEDSDLSSKIILRYLKSQKIEVTEQNIMRELRQETVAKFYFYQGCYV